MDFKVNGKPIELDLLTQQFIVHRWHTPLGRELRDKIIAAIKANKPVKPLLEEHILVHPANVESYEYPYYPPDAMQSQDFWVLANDDLRGIHFYEEDFTSTESLTKMNLSYGRLSKCQLNRSHFEASSFACTQFKACDLSNCVFEDTNGIAAVFHSCSLKNSVFLNTDLGAVDFSGSNLSGIYLEDTNLRNIKVNYLTLFDKTLKSSWHERKQPLNQRPDLYRNIRIAYETAELRSQADACLVRETSANRKYILWPQLKNKFSIGRLYVWARELTWSAITGHGTRPIRILLVGFVISLIYSLIYFFAGTPHEIPEKNSNFITALYFSFTTYSTLGYGDITYHADEPIMRLISTSEAWLGSILIALFVVIVARKIIRR